jgi:uncharacterized integral membrane protein
VAIANLAAAQQAMEEAGELENAIKNGTTGVGRHRLLAARIPCFSFRHEADRPDPSAGEFHPNPNHPFTMTTKIKLILGGVMLLLGIVFAVQNAPVVEVKFLVWSIRMSQALVIFLTGATGIIAGFFFGTAYKISRQA